MLYVAMEGLVKGEQRRKGRIDNIGVVEVIVLCVISHAPLRFREPPKDGFGLLFPSNLDSSVPIEVFRLAFRYSHRPTWFLLLPNSWPTTIESSFTTQLFKLLQPPLDTLGQDVNLHQENLQTTFLHTLHMTHFSLHTNDQLLHIMSRQVNASHLAQTS